MKNFNLLRKCQELQLLLCDDCASVDVSCQSSGYIVVTIVKQYINHECIGFLTLCSHDENFETRIDFLIKHGYKRDEA